MHFLPMWILASAGDIGPCEVAAKQFHAMLARYRRIVEGLGLYNSERQAETIRSAWKAVGLWSAVMSKCGHAVSPVGARSGRAGVRPSTSPRFAFEQQGLGTFSSAAQPAHRRFACKDHLHGRANSRPACRDRESCPA